LPIFKKDDGTITTGNASKINDAGCALILASGAEVKSRGLNPLAKIIGFADAELPPVDFNISPARAMVNLLKSAQMNVSEISSFEINEAFAMTALANMKLLGVSEKKVN
jgi:acetyl-CoA C-acetyltransferase